MLGVNPLAWPYLAQPYAGQTGTTNTDSGTGTITLAGSASDAAQYADAATGTITLAGTAADALDYTDAATGTITLTGTATDALELTDSGTGTIVLTGTATESWHVGIVYVDAGTGTITLTGTAVEHYIPPPHKFGGGAGGLDKRRDIWAESEELIVLAAALALA